MRLGAIIAVIAQVSFCFGYFTCALMVIAKGRKKSPRGD